MIVAALVLAIAISTGLGVMQFLLATGRPLGEYVWGGQQREATPKLRWSGAIAVVIYLGVCLMLTSRAGLLPGGESAPIVVATWVLFAYFVFMTGLNAVSRSRRERLVATPACALLALSVFVIALSPGA